MRRYDRLPEVTNNIQIYEVTENLDISDPGGPVVRRAIQWTPDPGLRCRIYGVYCEFYCGETLGTRSLYWRIISGNRSVFRSRNSAAIPATQTNILSWGDFGMAQWVNQLTGYFVSGLSSHIWWTHGMVFQVYKESITVDDDFRILRIWADTWTDTSYEVI